MLAIIDYGLGNLRSIQHKLMRSGIEAQISSDRKIIAEAGLLILPGVGHFAAGMRNLKEAGLIDVLNEKVLQDKTPVFGICLGMQLFTKWSEEGDVPGLGWIDGVTRRFRFESGKVHQKIPHIGWTTVKPIRPTPLLHEIPPDQRFYFVHSYHVCCEHPEDVLLTSCYCYEFTAAVQHHNIFGTQFHPEKSHRCGMQLVKNFVNVHKPVNPK